MRFSAMLRHDAAAALGWLTALLVLLLGLAMGAPAGAQSPAAARLGLGGEAATLAPSVPDAALAARLFGLAQDGQLAVIRQETPAPSWRVEAGGRALGLIGSTWELASSTGYSGLPLG